jgi:CheY-like chemotaxis protein
LKFEKLTPELLNEAIELYLQYAYDSEELRDKHRVSYPAGLSYEELLGQLEAEHDVNDNAAHKSYLIRLGSSDYPHMKLAIHEAYYKGEFIFTVDCHDGFRFDSSAPDYKEWLKLKNQNRQRKLVIEKEWYTADLPTLRRLKESALSRTDCIKDFRGHEILIIEDDPDGAAILSLILNSNGFKCTVVRGVSDTSLYVAQKDCKCGMAIIDVVLCDGSGVDALKAIRAEPQTQDIPIIMVSAMSSESVDYDGLTVENYLRKPFNAQDLIDRVEKILRTQYDGHKVFFTERKKSGTSFIKK